jgi:hypothetical protein
MQALLPLLAKPNQPERLYAALDAALAKDVGHKLLTLLCVDGSDVARVYSTQPDAYPLSERKPMGATAWGHKVLTNQEPFLGPDRESIMWAFYDHELIARLGLGSAITVPVVYDGTTLGSLNLLHEEHVYGIDHLKRVAKYAPLLIPAFAEFKRCRFATQTSEIMQLI